MKNIFFLSLITVLVISSSAMAAPAQKQSAVKNPGPGRLGFGVFGATPTIRYYFSDQFSGLLGFKYDSTSAAGSASQIACLANLSKEILKVGQNKLTLGVMVNYVISSGYASGVNTTTLAATFGIETKLNPNLVIGAVILPVSYGTSSAAGSSTTLGFLNNAVFTAHIFL
jgi:hypothetical protein